MAALCARFQSNSRCVPQYLTAPATLLFTVSCTLLYFTQPDLVVFSHTGAYFSLYWSVYFTGVYFALYSSLYFTAQFAPAPQGLSRLEKACAGLGLADAPTQRDKSTSATQRDKQGAIPVLIVSQQMGLSPVYHTPAIVYHIHARLYRNVIYVGRPLGADKPKLQQRAGGLWSFEG